MMFQNMRVKTKLAIGFGALTGAVLIVAALSIGALSEANKRFTSFLDKIDARANLAQSIRTALDRRAIAARNLVLVNTPADIELEKAAVTQAPADVQRDLREFNAMVAGADDITPRSARVTEINRVEALYGPVTLGIVDLALKGKQAEAVAEMNAHCRPLLVALVKATQDSIRTSRRTSRANRKRGSCAGPPKAMRSRACC